MSLRACFAFVALLAAAGCCCTLGRSDSRAASHGGGGFADVPPAPGQPQPAASASSIPCDVAADRAIVTAVRAEARALLEQGDDTGAVVVVDAAAPRLTCPSSKPELNAVRATLFSVMRLRTDGPCAAYGVGWRQRPDFAEVLESVAAVDPGTRALLEEVGSARVTTRWPAPGVDSALVAARIERGLRESLGVVGRRSDFTIDHVIDRCDDAARDEVLGKMHSYSCVGTASIDRDGDAWARVPVRYQILGISIGHAVSAFGGAGGGSGGSGGNKAFANEIKLRVLDDAEARLCSSR